MKNYELELTFAWDNDNWWCFTVVEAILADTSLQHATVKKKRFR
jgi:hypothetical protein